MPKYIVKLEDEVDNEHHYFVWCSVVDSPITEGLTEEQVKLYYLSQFKDKSLGKLNVLMERVERTGSSDLFSKTTDEFIAHNRAGLNGTELTKQEIINMYCKQNG